MGLGFAATGLLSPLVGLDIAIGSVLGLAIAVMLVKEGSHASRRLGSDATADRPLSEGQQRQSKADNPPDQHHPCAEPGED